MAITTSYNLSPTPQSGQGAFGSVPGNLSLPPDIYSQVASLYPGITSTGSTALGNINSELAGKLSPGTTQTLTDSAAARGVASGMPWTTSGGMDTARFLQSIGLTSEGLAHQGQQDYLSFLTGVGSTQTNPQTALDVQQQNAVNNAAPNPQQAQSYAEQLYQKYMQMMNPATGKSSFSIGGSPGGFNVGGGDWFSQENNASYQNYLNNLPGNNTNTW